VLLKVLYYVTLDTLFIGVSRCFTSEVSTALAKSCYGQDQASDMTFDVVTSFDDNEKPTMLAWVISYNRLDCDKLDWKPCMGSENCSSIEDAYQSLIRGLQSKMVDLMG